MSKYSFTVFTPIYNRKHTIHRVWDSLNQQTFRDFEWVIINDGSEDGIEPLLESYKEKADFPVRIYHQKNSGKHVAFNRAVELAEGELLVPADSDDSFVPETLAVFNKFWGEYKDNSVSGISVLCMDENNSILGDQFKTEGLSNHFEVIYNDKIRGEKWGCIRTEVMRKFRFPELPGSFFPESYVWSQIGLEYQTVYLNIPLRKYHQDAGNQIMKTTEPSEKVMRVRAYYYLWWINTILPKAGKYISSKEKYKNFVSLWRFSILLNTSPSSVLKKVEKGSHKVIAALLYLPSFFVYKVLKKKHY